MDDNRLWDLADKWLPEPGAGQAKGSGQAKRPRLAKSPLLQTSKAPEANPKMFSPEGSSEKAVSHPPK
eukprot:1154735-Karenia_brevis.AAC.1